MKRFSTSLLLTAVLASGAFAQTSDGVPWSLVPDAESGSTPPPLLLAGRDAAGLPGERPRLTMNLPLGEQARSQGFGDERDSAFSWSLKTWQLNTASLAHIQCNRATLTIDSYLAQDCRFVDQPLPRDSVNLLQVRGDWMALPGLQVGLGAFQADGDTSSLSVINPENLLMTTNAHQVAEQGAQADARSVEGLDFNVSFGIQTERVGDFLVGLQLARYRQRMSLSELGLSSDQLDTSYGYGNSAELMLGWRRGSFSGEMLGYHRESPLWLDGQSGSSTLNSFDLEFSWHAPHNASISIGVSNVMDAAPRSDEASGEARLEDPMENVYGRIPYVRYKQDL